jgi:hypothetical protein
LIDFLPFETQAGELAPAVSQSLLYLATQGEITMAPRQDSPNKSYIGEQPLRHIAQAGGEA